MWDIRYLSLKNALKRINDKALLELDHKYDVQEYTPEKSLRLLAKLLGIVVSLRQLKSKGTTMHVLNIENDKTRSYGANPRPFRLCEREEGFMTAFYLYEKYFEKHQDTLSKNFPLERKFQNYVRQSLIRLLLGNKTMNSVQEEEEEREFIRDEFGLSEVEEECDESSHTAGFSDREIDDPFDSSDSDSD